MAMENLENQNSKLEDLEIDADLAEKADLSNSIQVLESEKTKELGGIPDLFKDFLNTLSKKFSNNNDKSLVELFGNVAEDTLRITLQKEYPKMPVWIVDGFIKGLHEVSKTIVKHTEEPINNLFDEETKRTAYEIASYTPSQTRKKMKEYIENNYDPDDIKGDLKDMVGKGTKYVKDGIEEGAKYVKDGIKEGTKYVEKVGKKVKDGLKEVSGRF